MNFYFDTEFIDNGQTIDLISIGMINDNGDTFYRVSSEFDVDAVLEHPWLSDNVWPHIENDVAYENTYTKAEIAKDLLKFVDGHRHIEFWAFCGAYDFVALRQLFGRGIDGPSWLPFYYNEIQSLARLTNSHIIRTLTDKERHHALKDAKEVKAMYEMIRGNGGV
jgi:hypothetical protein